MSEPSIWRVQDGEITVTATRQPFIWRAQDGDIAVDAMRTTHLFYTVRLLWNHSVALDYRIGEKRKLIRHFGPRHPGEYLQTAFIALVDELARRVDLPTDFSRQLQEITEHLQVHPELAQRIGDVPREPKANSKVRATVAYDLESANYEAGLMYRPR